MSGKKGLPSPIEPQWQGRYFSVPRLEAYTYPQPSVDTRNSPDRRSIKSTTSIRRQIQVQDPRRENFAHDLVSGIENPNLWQSRLANTGSLRLDTIGRDRGVGPASFDDPRLTEATNPGIQRGGQISGTELRLDADCVSDKNDADSIDREYNSHRRAAAEQAAARFAARKTKRFSLTHQQTGILISEFAKEPYPCTAHRELLSREISGLSPRQVQVWFQNRRATIKRHMVNYPDRIIRMRREPDDSGNIQALQLPYGGADVVGVSTPRSDLGAMVGPYRSNGATSLILKIRRPGEPVTNREAILALALPLVEFQSK